MERRRAQASGGFSAIVEALLPAVSQGLADSRPKTAFIENGVHCSMRTGQRLSASRLRHVMCFN